MTLTTTATAKNRAMTGRRMMTTKEQQQRGEGRHDQNKNGGGDESRTTTAYEEGVKDRDSTVRRGRQAQGGRSAFFFSLAITNKSLQGSNSNH